MMIHEQITTLRTLHARWLESDCCDYAAAQAIAEALPGLMDELELLTEKNNPYWDATDAAHPAWWRGQDSGIAGVCERVTEMLDGTRKSPCGYEFVPLQEVCERIGRLLADYELRGKFLEFTRTREAEAQVEREDAQREVATLRTERNDWRSRALFAEERKADYTEEIVTLSKQCEMLETEQNRLQQQVERLTRERDELRDQILYREAE